MKVETNEKNMLESILSSIEAALLEDEEDDFYEILGDIPQALWTDSSSSLRIIATIVSNIPSVWEISTAKFIPDAFWTVKENAIAAIRIIYSANNPGVYAVYPNTILEDKDCALEIVSGDPNELGYISKDLREDSEVVLAALDALQEEIEDSYHHFPALPLDSRACLEFFINCSISASLKSNRNFILEFLKRDYFESEFDLLYDWIDPKLWSDKEFVIAVLELDSYADIRVSKKLLFDIENQSTVED